MLERMLEIVYQPLDLFLGWVAYVPSVAAISLIGVLSGIVITVIQKYGSRQELLARCKADLKLLKSKMRTADPESARRLRTLTRRIGGKYAWGAIKPSFWTVPLITWVALWTGARLGHAPVRPGEALEVRAHFEDGASGYAHVLPGQTLKPDSALIAAIIVPDGEPAAGRQARWTFRASEEGSDTLTIRHASKAYDVTVPVARSGGLSPPRVTVFSESSSTQDQLQAVELGLAPSLPPAWWNLQLQWAGLYLLVAVAVALGLRFALRIH